jgi:hypothetical protein
MGWEEVMQYKYPISSLAIAAAYFYIGTVINALCPKKRELFLCSIMMNIR